METQLLEKDPALKEIVRRLIDTFKPLKIYLFGSKRAEILMRIAIMI